MSKIIPDDVGAAAGRSFIRTSAQSLAATLSTATLSIAAVAAFIATPDWQMVASVIGFAIISTLLSGSVAALQVISSGLPSEYTSTDSDTYDPKH